MTLTRISVALGLFLSWGVASAASAFLVTVDPGLYSGEYVVSGGSRVSGLSTTDLAAGPHTVSVAFIGSVSFTVDGLGNITSCAPVDSVTCAGSTLFLENATIQVDPGAYQGEYRVNFDPRVVGLQTSVVVPGSTMTQGVGIAFVGSVSFTVDGLGNITSCAPVDSVTCAGSTLFLQNATIQVDPGAYQGEYRVNFDPRVVGLQTSVVVPGSTMTQGVGIAFVGPASFVVDGLDNITSCAPVDSVTCAGSTLFFENVTIFADPGTFTGLYRINFDPTDTGVQSSVVVPGATMVQRAALASVGNASFTVLDPCQITPTLLAVASETLELSCSLEVDTDGDGVCDPDAITDMFSGCTGSDNCIDVINPAQTDADGNGVGDLCDATSCSAIQYSCNARRKTDEQVARDAEDICKEDCEVNYADNADSDAKKACKAHCKSEKEAAFAGASDAEEACRADHPCSADGLCKQAAKNERHLCDETSRDEEEGCRQGCKSAHSGDEDSDARKICEGVCKADKEAAQDVCKATEAATGEIICGATEDCLEGCSDTEDVCSEAARSAQDDCKTQCRLENEDSDARHSCNDGCKAARDEAMTQCRIDEADCALACSH